MNIGDEVYYKRVDGTYIKARIVDVDYSPTWNYVIEFIDNTGNIANRQQRKANNTKIVPESVYNSPLWKQLTEIKKEKANEQTNS